MVGTVKGTGSAPARDAGGAHTAVELREVILAERAGRPFVTWRASDGGQQIRILDGDTWRITIGRDPGADIALDWDPEVSRAHAVLELIGTGWVLIDEGLSRNGSFVNGERVIGRRRLADGDHICVGRTEMTYRGPAHHGSAPTVPVADAAPALSLSPMQRRVLVALCRPVHESEAATPATNQQIADEVHLTVAAVKAHLRVLFERYGLSDLPQNEKRARLVMNALVSGVIAPRDF